MMGFILAQERGRNFMEDKEKAVLLTMAKAVGVRLRFVLDSIDADDFTATYTESVRLTSAASDLVSVCISQDMRLKNESVSIQAPSGGGVACHQIVHAESPLPDWNILPEQHQP
jgi:hypothetical protein